MEVIKTKLEKVLLVKPDIYEDFRGSNFEIYNEELYKNNGIDAKFIHDTVSVSSKNVLRGIHGDSESWKLISCLYGKIYFVVVNCDKDSEGFGRWESFDLSDENRYQVLVPPKFGNAHLALSDKVVFHYRWSTYYNRDKQFSIRYDDPRFKIWWPVKNPILSVRDETADGKI
jgi:dTDP-4-dehydrorhamnose 3,5-epimerase